MLKRQLMSFTLCLGTILTSCEKKDEAPPAPPPVEVTSYEVKQETVPVVYDFVGFAESSHPVEIRARVEGYLDTIAYKEGSVVDKGDLLFQLDPQQFVAKVESSKGEVLRQQALLENAILTVNRLQPLYEQKAASKKDLDNAIASKLSYEATLQTAKADLLNSEINLGYTTITSPIKGATDKSKFREGSLITPGENGLLTTVSVLDPIWVYFTVSDNDILRVSKQSISRAVTLPKDDDYVVQVVLSDGSVFPHKGKIDYSAPNYSQSTGSLQVRAVFDNPVDEDKLTLHLHPGQFVHVKVYGAERQNALMVPQRALLQKKNGMFVYLIRNDKVIAQDVSLGEWYQNYQIVTNGLEPGDQIVVDGINKIQPRSTVKVIGTWNPTTDTKDTSKLKE